MSYPKVFIIILNWNGLQDTLECLESVSALNYPQYEIVVVDNGSTDKPTKAIADKYPKVKLILNDENLGYSGGNNVGIKHALEHDAEYVWLLNNDTVVDADALLSLINITEKDQSIGIAGSKIYYFDNPGKIWFAGSHIYWWRGYSDHNGKDNMDNGQYDNVEQVDRVTGCSMLVKKEVCNKVGILDENFFLYVEEVDWCVRARKAGFKCIFVPSSVVHHKISASVAKTGITDKIFDYYDTRNFLYLINKTFKFPLREIILLKVIFKKINSEKMDNFKLILSFVSPRKKLESINSPVMFGIRDFFIKRMGKANYNFNT